MGRKPTERRDRIVQVRLTPSEMDAVRLSMLGSGYPTVSGYLRDLLAGRRPRDHRRAVTVDDGVLSDALNRLVTEVRRIGVNYNQAVAAYHRQLRHLRPSAGLPGLRETDEAVGTLTRMTGELRREVALLLELCGRRTETNP